MALTVLALAAAGCSSSEAAETDPIGAVETSTSLPEAHPAPVFGAAVPGGTPAAVSVHEERAGSPLGVVRVFARWDTAFPDADHRRLLDSGRPIHLSVRPRTDAGEVVPWADIATAEEGSDIHRFLVRWATVVAPYRDRLFFTFNHEPETADSAANGTSEEFVAAWRRVAEVFAERDADRVPLVVVLGRGAYADGSIDEWYPGDDVVDAVGVDAYNWFDCQGTDRPWTSPAELLAPAVAFADAHDKPLAIPEIGSTEDPSDLDRKAAWIDELVVEVERLAAAGQPIWFVAWFDVHDRSWPACFWSATSTPATADAFDRAVRHFAPSANGASASGESASGTDDAEPAASS